MTNGSSLEPRKWLWLHREDNVAMALTGFAAGNVVQINGFRDRPQRFQSSTDISSR